MSAAVSRWSDAACRPERESAISSSIVGGVATSSGSAGPPRPIATTTTLRSRASSRATWPVTAVFPTRLPVPITAIDGSVERMERRRVEAEVGADVRQPEREEARRERKPQLRRQHRLVGEVDDDLGVARLLDDRHAVVRRAAQLLGAADQDHADELVRQLRERLAHDVRIVLAVDDGDSLHRFDVTSPSIRAVYFSYVFVSVENWMMRSWLWNGYFRQTSTWVPETSTML